MHPRIGADNLRADPRPRKPQMTIQDAPAAAPSVGAAAPALGDMPPEEFRRHAHAAVDWMADYLASVEDYPVLSRVQPGDVAARLPAHPPMHGEELGAGATCRGCASTPPSTCTRPSTRRASRWGWG